MRYFILGVFCVSLLVRADFADITEEAGLAGVGGSHISWIDYDNDGYEDILIGSKHLFRNNGPPDWNFTKVTESAGISESKGGFGIFGDYDNDGYLDFHTGEMLWHNNGDGTFTDVTQEAGNICDTFPTPAAAWGDYDGDGYIDLYIANGEYYEDENYTFFPDFLWHNEGDGTFTDVTDEAGIDSLHRFWAGEDWCYGRGVAWADYDEDGDLDIYVANYRLCPNFLWQNNSDGTFTDVAQSADVIGKPYALAYGHSIAASWGDLDNDCHLDLFVANLAHKDPDRGRYCDDSYLFHNNGPPDWNFTDIRKGSGIPIIPIRKVHPSGYYWDELHDGIGLGDYDNDGDLDLYITQVYDLEFAFSFFYENNGDLTFTDVTEDAKVKLWDCWGPVWCDYDQDGDLDLIVYGSAKYPIESREVHLFKNNGNNNHWLEIRLIGKNSNRTAIGARVKTVAGDLKQIRQVEGGTGNGCQHSLILHFGLSTYKNVDTVYVRWPSGLFEYKADIPADQLLVWEEGDGEEVGVEERRPKSISSFNSVHPNPFSSSTTISYSVNLPAYVSLKVYNSSGQLIKILVSEEKATGNYTILWKGTDDTGHLLPNGVYFLRLESGNYSSTRKGLIVRH